MAKHRVPNTPSVFEGEVYPTTESGNLVITKYVKAKEVHVRFIDTGYETVSQAVTIKRGLVRDRSIERIAGVGYAPAGSIRYEEGTVTHKAYSAWHSMITRCYKEDSSHYKYYGERGVLVCERWHNFQNFAEWYVPKYFEGCQIDKDLLSGGTKTYSPETCCLLPKELNILISPNKKNSKYGRGVYKDGRKYYTRVCHMGGLVAAASFSTSDEAHDYYVKMKKQLIKSRAKHYLDSGVIDEPIYRALCGFTPL